MSDTIERSIEIAAPLTRVWELVTVPGWWVTESSDTDADRTVGSVTVTQTESGKKFPVEVVQLRPEIYAAFRWASQFPGEDPVEGRATLVEFTLEPQETAILVTVRESGFSTLDASDEVRRSGIEDNTSGWEQMLGLLSRHAVA